MKDEFRILGKPWLLWEHDPCVEGGWSVNGFDTKQAAIEAAQLIHKQREASFQEMVEYSKNNSWPEVWTRENECYDGCVVTPGLVFRLDVVIPDKT